MLNLPHQFQTWVAGAWARRTNRGKPGRAAAAVPVAVLADPVDTPAAVLVFEPWAVERRIVLPDPVPSACVHSNSRHRRRGHHCRHCHEGTGLTDAVPEFQPAIVREHEADPANGRPAEHARFSVALAAPLCENSRTSVIWFRVQTKPAKPAKTPAKTVARSAFRRDVRSHEWPHWMHAAPN